MQVVIEYTPEEVRTLIAQAAQRHNSKTLAKRGVAPTNVHLESDGSAKIVLPGGVEKDHE